MDLRLALLDASDVALTTGIIAGQVTLAAGADAALPEWIKVTPRGRVTARDGRGFDFDPAVLAARFKADAIDIPVDTDHSTVLLGGQGRAPTTIGYASAVEARDDGTYARVEWNGAGRTTLAARTHRYVSPTIHTDANGRATWLHSVALVSAPALSMPAAVLHSLQGNPMKEIAKALGLAEDATEAACLAALRGHTALKPLAAALGLPETADGATLLQAATTLKAGAGDKGLVATLQAELTITNGRLASVMKAARDRDVSELLGAALKDLKILPTDVDHYTKLCATDDGLATVKVMLAGRVPLLRPSGLDGLVPPTGGSPDAQTLMVRAKKIEAEMLAAGTPIMWADAVTRAQHEKA